MRIDVNERTSANDDFRAFAGKLHCRSLPDPGRSAGDDSNFVFNAKNASA